VRILHISTRLILGGSQENTILSCEGQARRGHEVHLAFGPIYGPEGSLLPRVEEFNLRCREGAQCTPDGSPVRPIEIHIVPHLVRQVSPFHDFVAVRQIRKLIEHVEPDVVHTHSSKAGILGREAAWRVAQRRPMTVVHTIHGPPFMPVAGGTFERARVRFMNHAYTLAERRAARHCHTLVSVADAMTREFLARGIGHSSQYITVRSGIETEPYLLARPGETRPEVRARLGVSEADFVIGTVSRLAEHKGHDDLLDALGEDLRRNPRWKLLWVGDGWWRERLVRKAEAIGLRVRELDREKTSERTRPGPVERAQQPAQVILTGLVSPGAVPGLIRAMDILAHPSYREGLPRTVPQALLTGVCPVAYDVDGTGEICREMETGRLVAPGDLAALAAAVRWCEANPALRRALADRGREECRVVFSAETMVEALQRVYERRG
jgi:glycosyltransferase involved in cell wall biosynthesis